MVVLSGNQENRVQFVTHWPNPPFNQKLRVLNMRSAEIPTFYFLSLLITRMLQKFVDFLQNFYGGTLITNLCQSRMKQISASGMSSWEPGSPVLMWVIKLIAKLMSRE